MKTPEQNEITAFFQGRNSMAEEVEAAIARAKAGKKSVEREVRQAINMQTWQLRAEAHGYDAGHARPPRIDDIAICALISFVLMVVFFMWVSS